jgi:hypothetical protein
MPGPVAVAVYGVGRPCTPARSRAAARLKVPTRYTPGASFCCERFEALDTDHRGVRRCVGGADSGSLMGRVSAPREELTPPADDE